MVKRAIAARPARQLGVLAACARRCPATPDLNIALGYETPAVVKIKDYRLGLLFLGFQLVILGYVIIYQLVFQQSARVEGIISGSARIRVEAPPLIYRTPEGILPYCLNTTAAKISAAAAISTRYRADYVGAAFPTNGTYVMPGGVVAPQLPCAYLDTTYLIPDPSSVDGVFMPTALSLSTQVVPPECSQFLHPQCRCDRCKPFHVWLSTLSRTCLVSLQFVDQRRLSLPHLCAGHRAL